MSNTNIQAGKLVILVTRGIDHELSSVAFTIANGGISAGQQVSIFLTSCGIDLVRKRGADMTKVDPLEPLSNLMADFLKRDGKIWACAPCVRARGYEQDDLIDGVVITGASLLHQQIIDGAATLSF